MRTGDLRHVETTHDTCPRRHTHIKCAHKQLIGATNTRCRYMLPGIHMDLMSPYSCIARTVQLSVPLLKSGYRRNYQAREWKLQSQRISLTFMIKDKPLLQRICLCFGAFDVASIVWRLPLVSMLGQTMRIEYELTIVNFSFPINHKVKQIRFSLLLMATSGSLIATLLLRPHHALFPSSHHNNTPIR